MPKPLIIDNSGEGLSLRARAVKAAATILGGGAVLGAIALAIAGRERVHFTPGTPLWAGLFRALIFGLPVLGAVAIMLDPVRYRLRPREVLAERWNYVRDFRRMWWAFSPLWPGIALAVYAWWEAAFVRPLPVGEPVAWWWALGTYLLVLVMAFYCTGIFLTATETRFDDEGVRCGLNRFMEWENVAQAVVGRRWVALFHRGVLGSPVRTIPRRDPVVEAELMRRLRERGVPVVEHAATRLPVLRVLYAGTAAVLGAAALAVRARGVMSDVWLAVVLLVAGSLACTALDRLRGFHLLTRVRPMTMSAAAADALEGTPQTRAAQDPLSQDDWAAKARRDW
jgi:hypothetical protein